MSWRVSLSLLVAFGVVPGLAAQVPANCKHVCNQTYALCIAASCDPQTGQCGVCDATDGSCGFCYVFEGESCSYGSECADLQPSGSTVYSTYSERLTTQFGFQVLTCKGSKSSADCMDAKCTLTGETVVLKDKDGQEHEVPTAVCGCRLTPGGGSTLGGQCNAANCSATWSVAGGVLENLPHCEPGETGGAANPQ